MCDDIRKISNDNTFELAMPIYIILHEGGHALITSLYGAKIIEFNIMEGYIIAPGGVFSEITLALFYEVFSGIILFSIGVWVIMPIQYMMGIANPNDDVGKFTNEYLYWGYMEEKIFQNGYRVLKLGTSVEKHKFDYEIDHE